MNRIPTAYEFTKKLSKKYDSTIFPETVYAKELSTCFLSAEDAAITGFSAEMISAGDLTSKSDGYSYVHYNCSNLRTPVQETIEIFGPGLKVSPDHVEIGSLSAGEINGGSLSFGSMNVGSLSAEFIKTNCLSGISISSNAISTNSLSSASSINTNSLSSKSIYCGTTVLSDTNGLILSGTKGDLSSKFKNWIPDGGSSTESISIDLLSIIYKNIIDLSNRNPFFGE